MDEGRKYSEFKNTEHHRHKVRASKEENDWKNYQATRTQKDHKNYKSGISAKGYVIKKPKRSMEHSKSHINKAARLHKTTPE